MYKFSSIYKIVPLNTVRKSDCFDGLSKLLVYVLKWALPSGGRRRTGAARSTFIILLNRGAHSATQCSHVK